MRLTEAGALRSRAGVRGWIAAQRQFVAAFGPGHAAGLRTPLRAVSTTDLVAPVARQHRPPITSSFLTNRLPPIGLLLPQIQFRFARGWAPGAVLATIPKDQLRHESERRSGPRHDQHNAALFKVG